MRTAAAVIIAIVVLLVAAAAVWSVAEAPARCGTLSEPAGWTDEMLNDADFQDLLGGTQSMAIAMDADMAQEVSRKERYGEPPGDARAVHPDELGCRGWPDMPVEYEGSSASSMLAHVERSA